MRHYRIFKYLILTLAIFSCSEPDSSKINNVSSEKKSKKVDIVDSLAAPKNLFIKDDSAYLTINKKTFILNNVAGIESKNSYPAICEILGDSLKRVDALVLGNYIYFTTYTDLGTGYRGFFYVYDIEKKQLIKDPDFKHSYLYSSIATFIIDKNTHKIFSVNKPNWFFKNGKWFVSACMYAIKGNKFNFYKNVYEYGENDDDNFLIKFYHKSLANNAKNGKTLPKNWWK